MIDEEERFEAPKALVEFGSALQNVFNFFQAKNNVLDLQYEQLVKVTESQQKQISELEAALQELKDENGIFVPTEAMMTPEEFEVLPSQTQIKPFEKFRPCSEIDINGEPING